MFSVTKAKTNGLSHPIPSYVKVISWNEGSGTVDTNHEDGRSYISAISEVIYANQTCEGTAKVFFAHRTRRKEDLSYSRFDITGVV